MTRPRWPLSRFRRWLRVRQLLFERHEAVKVRPGQYETITMRLDWLLYARVVRAKHETRRVA